MVFRKSFLVVSMFVVASASALAQLKVDSLTGTFTGGGEGDVFGGGTLDTTTAGDSIRFSGASAELGNDDSPYGSRGIVRMESFGASRMSYDALGNLSDAIDGEVRKFTTWNSMFMDTYGQPGYFFGAESDGSGEPSSVDIQFYNMGFENLTGTVNSPVQLDLDGSEFDLNPEAGKIKISRDMHPQITSTLGHFGGGSVRRDLYWDGDAMVAAPFHDSAFLTVNAEITMNGFYRGGASSNFVENLAAWTPGEDDTALKSFGGGPTQMTFSFNSLENGVYQLSAYAALWQRLGGDAIVNVTGSGVYPGTSSSRFDGSGAEYELEVVPEPGTMLALGLGAAALVRRRNRR